MDWLVSFAGYTLTMFVGLLRASTWGSAFRGARIMYEEFGVQDDGSPVLCENKSDACNAIYGYPGGPDRAATWSCL